MVRNPVSEDMSINVFLINGEEFIDRDVPQAPFGELEKSVCFWDDDKLVMYPMSQVGRVELLFNK
jgi:hypothetical protein